MGVTQASTRTANGIGHGGDALLLPDHPLVQALLHQQQLVTLALHQLGHRYAGGTGHHFGDFFGTHLGAQQAWLPADLAPGDLLAVAATGAYGRSMASNYNHVPRPPVVAVSEDSARLIVRRETVEDILALDVD